METIVSCPGCQTQLKMAQPLGPGEQLRCPKCQTVFGPDSPQEEGFVKALAVPGPVVPREGSTRPAGEDFSPDEIRQPYPERPRAESGPPRTRYPERPRREDRYAPEGFGIKWVFIVGGGVLVIAIIVGLMLVGLNRGQNGAARAATNNNLRQCAIAVHSHATDWKRVPPANGYFPRTDKTGTCFGHLLPYLEQKPLWDMNQNLTGIVDFVPVYQAASDPTATTFTGPVTSFGANGAVFGTGDRNIDGSMPDGTSNVILFATVCQQCNGATNWATGNRCVFGTRNPNGTYIVDTSLPSPNVTGIANCGTGSFCMFGNVGISTAMGDHVVKVISRGQQVAGWAVGMHPDDRNNPVFD